MRVLLDTHVLIWYLEGDSLPPSILNLLEDESNDRIVSIVSLWELTIKVSLRKLQLSKTLDEIQAHLLSKINFEILNIELPHLNHLIDLPKFDYHKDPFDRLLIAQAISEQLTIISADRHFSDYPVPVIW